MGHARQSEYSENERKAVVRRIMLGRSTLEEEAQKFHISTRSIEDWLNSAPLRNGLRFTAKSSWRPKQYPREFKEKCVARVRRGESPANIAKETLGLLPGVIRNWSLGIDMEEVEIQTETRETRPYRAPAATPRPLPESEPVAPARNPKRDEAVKAFRAGMPIADIITVLELKVTPDAIRDWDAEDRLAERAKNGTPANAPRYTEEQKQAALDRIFKGESPTTIADELGCSTRLLRIWADARMQARKQQAARQTFAAAEEESMGGSRARSGPGGRSQFTDEQQKDACHRVARGYDIVDVASELGVDKSTVYSWARKWEINLTARARFDEDFKAKAVQRVLDQGERQVDVCRSLRIEQSLLSDWVSVERNRRAAQAGQAPPPRGGPRVPSKYTDAQQIAFVKRWLNGEKPDDLAAEMGMSPANLYSWAEKHGLEKPNMQQRYRSDHPVRVDAVRQVLDEGVEPEVIAKKLGLGLSAIKSWVRDERRDRQNRELEDLKAAANAARERRLAELEAAAAAKANPTPALAPEPEPEPEPPKVEAAPPVPESFPAVQVETMPATPPEPATLYYRVDTVPLPQMPPPPVPVMPRAPVQTSVPRPPFQPTPVVTLPHITPAPAPAVSPRKAKVMQMLLCASCESTIIVPISQNPNALVVTQGKCPHCHELVDL